VTLLPLPSLVAWLTVDTAVLPGTLMPLCRLFFSWLYNWKPTPMTRSVRATGVELQEIPQLIIVYEILLQPTSRRFLRELDKALGGNTLHYILQYLRVPASVTRVWTRKVHWVATECSWNDRSETQYYIVILDRLQGRSRELEQIPELRVRGSLTHSEWLAPSISECPSPLSLSLPLREIL